ncbi:hypothetical protein H8L32_03565 [Undibacterium sp. CY18W]|uniref:Uncharacterized protein n=1 Tax=Undibacterium hunanense TaxID=2762292 RepID=A0ABR6ZL78_9BURK|nr:hypothetical protein [Undibacterium hunanense]MBC3916554.1 hypothetical protein [Undibacterium hunanense]
MSGPTTVLINGDVFLILLSAAAIRAARAVIDARQQANALRQYQTEQHAALLDRLQNALVEGRQALQEQVSIAEQDFAQLLVLADKIGCTAQVSAVRPTVPASNDEQDIIGYCRSLQLLIHEMRPVLLQESTRRADALFDNTDADLQAASAAVLPQDRLARLLKRIAHLTQLPEHIAQLAKELEKSLPGERADLLAAELRLQIQALLEAEKKRQVEEAQALILEQTLQDLGYQVEEVTHTLFVDGGVVHFRRADWDKYMVRMRMDARTGQANFNVVRAVKEGENERSVLDHLAEDRWCSEFPTLLAALEARGIHMQVTRRLEAGELPVQLVLEDKLPQFVEEEQMENQSRLLSKKLP